MNEVVIIDAVRTPIGKFGGSLKDISAVDLGATALKGVLERANIAPDRVDQVIFGNVLQAGLGQNVARQVAIKAGIPYKVPGVTINEVCGSGLKSIMLGRQAIQLGEADIVAVGGTENMSQAPLLLNPELAGEEINPKNLRNSMLIDGLTDVYGEYHMGITAENVAEKFSVSREEQDKFAHNSQMKAASAQEKNLFTEEIIPVELPDGSLFEADETIRANSTLEKLATLKSVFKEDGTVTAGNASGINDGASAIILMSKEKAIAENIPYIATIKVTSEIGVDPAIMGYAPYYAVNEALAKGGYTIDEIDLFHLNEAFASQSVAVARDLEIPEEKLNIYGGAIALGHPIGASGARIIASLLNELKHENKHLGVASLCIGGGIGIAIIVERA
ncbi:thiolase family protein [Listeria cossartiae subsp. cayugensis]|uniref:acetyl-CoA C-acetyltransferase n=1 Tax=Listeria cossartiae subsp. cayugensis TaxID=2713505 RepID=A0ABU2IL06_9LIST|nr:thiolase family protein [Listeria cossartiae]MDT0048371.1 thiolase family protein [Listeria cossartiae subsp. cayugensis]MDT0064874.1 thiolase family protein [Listeria cossartiae subsp. cayugensis]MDT0079522.1 thiolase family protein [Listeria cossartiae subsp. cayugensis]MDT0082358.1 thiolase family protein [Listeria cossartiae subsp. cayugensis]MDT0087107.1 thiolase family protein [Listeria cossartiae subsp. cayugensis]